MKITDSSYKWVALGVTTVGAMMVAIDSTIVILALPNMLQDLHSNLAPMYHGMHSATCSSARCSC